ASCKVACEHSVFVTTFKSSVVDVIHSGMKSLYTPVPSVGISSGSVADFSEIISVIDSKVIIHIYVDCSWIKKCLVDIVVINRNHFSSHGGLSRRGHQIQELINRPPANLTENRNVRQQKNNKYSFFEHQLKTKNSIG